MYEYQWELNPDFVGAWPTQKKKQFKQKLSSVSTLQAISFLMS